MFSQRRFPGIGDSRTKSPLCIVVARVIPGPSISTIDPHLSSYHSNIMVAIAWEWIERFSILMPSTSTIWTIKLGASATARIQGTCRQRSKNKRNGLESRMNGAKSSPCTTRRWRWKTRSWRYVTMRKELTIARRQPECIINLTMLYHLLVGYSHMYPSVVVWFVMFIAGRKVQICW